jgi:hypothetical protein
MTRLSGPIPVSLFRSMDPKSIQYTPVLEPGFCRRPRSIDTDHLLGLSVDEGRLPY